MPALSAAAGTTSRQRPRPRSRRRPSPSLPPHLTSPHRVALPASRCQVGVNLGQPGGYLDTIAKGTADIDIQVVFCNAGYVLTGFFVDV